MNWDNDINYFEIKKYIKILLDKEYSDEDIIKELIKTYDIENVVAELQLSKVKNAQKNELEKKLSDERKKYVLDYALKNGFSEKRIIEEVKSKFNVSETRIRKDIKRAKIKYDEIIRKERVERCPSNRIPYHILDNISVKVINCTCRESGFVKLSVIVKNRNNIGFRRCDFNILMYDDNHRLIDICKASVFSIKPYTESKEVLLCFTHYKNIVSYKLEFNNIVTYEYDGCFYNESKSYKESLLVNKKSDINAEILNNIEIKIIKSIFDDDNLESRILLKNNSNCSLDLIEIEARFYDEDKNIIDIGKSSIFKILPNSDTAHKLTFYNIDENVKFYSLKAVSILI